MENQKPDKTLLLCAVIISAICAIVWDKLVLFSICLLLIIGFGIWKKGINWKFSLILVLFFILSAVYTDIRKPLPDTLSSFNQQEVLLEGNVISLPDKNSNGKTRFHFNVKTITNTDGKIFGVENKTQVYLPLEITQKISRGDYLKLNAYILVPESYHNEGEFDYQKYLANSRIFTLAFAKDVEFIDKEPNIETKILKKIDNIREKIIEKHSKILNEEKTEILGGVVFGSEAIKPSLELKNIFIESGLYHLLAASGMNVAFIFGIWFFLLKRFRVPHKLIIISGGIVVLFYALMTGLPPSVTRATWMLELALVGKLIDRNSDNNLILLLVCALMLLFNPFMLNDIGFILSFGVTFGLINCATPLIDKIKFLPARISSWIIIPFVAQIFAAPIQVYFFQTLSLYSILANIIVIPFMAVISFCGFISSILALLPKIGDNICFILDKINEPFLNFLLFVAQYFANLPNNIACFSKLHLAQITLYYLLVFVLVYMIKNNFKNIYQNIFALVIFITLIFSAVEKSPADELSFTFFNVGEADSIFITTPNNKKILVDAGRTYGSSRNSGNMIILPYFQINGISNLDMMVLTHPDSDHIGGSVSVLEGINVEKLITNGESAENKSYLKLQKYLETTNRQEKIIDHIEEISPDENLSIIAIKPIETNDLSKNDTSIILLIKYKDFDAILMGDNESNSYEILKQNLNPTGDIELFKVGHHGSYHSVNKKMSELINPAISIISVGENHYGHPHKRVLNNLKKSKILRTDKDNAIKIKTDGTNYDVYTYDYKKGCWRKKRLFNMSFNQR